MFESTTVGVALRDVCVFFCAGDRAEREGSLYEGHRACQRRVDPLHDGESARHGRCHPWGKLTYEIAQLHSVVDRDRFTDLRVAITGDAILGVS